MIQNIVQGEKSVPPKLISHLLVFFCYLVKKLVPRNRLNYIFYVHLEIDSWRADF